MNKFMVLVAYVKYNSYHMTSDICALSSKVSII